MFKRLFSESRMTRECPVRFCEKFSGLVGGFIHYISKNFLRRAICSCLFGVTTIFPMARFRSTEKGPDVVAVADQGASAAAAVADQEVSATAALEGCIRLAQGLARDISLADANIAANTTHRFWNNNINPCTLQELNEAIVYGNSRAVKRAIANHCPLKKQTGDDEALPSPLYYAVLFMPQLTEQEQHKLMQPEQDHKHGRERDVLYLAGTHERRIKLFKRLLVASVRVDDFYDAQGLTAAHLAIQKNNSAVLQLLLNSRLILHPDQVISRLLSEKPAQTLLEYAICQRNVSCVEKLCDSGADINRAKAVDQLTPFLLSAKVGDLAIFKLLISKEVNIFAKTNKGENLLHCAVIGGNKDILLRLMNVIKLRKAQDDCIQAVTSAGRAVVRSTEDMFIEQVYELIDKAEDFSAEKIGKVKAIVKDLVEKNAPGFVRAMISGKVEELFGEIDIKQLFRHVHEQVTTQERISELLRGRSREETNTLKIDSQTTEGYSLLHYAMMHDRSYLIPLLLCQGARLNVGMESAIRQLINVADNNGETPLLRAVRKNDNTAVKSLLMKLDLIDDLLVNREAQTTILHWLVEQQEAEGMICVLFDEDRTLERAKELLAQRNAQGNTPLHVTANFDDKKIYNLLLGQIPKEDPHFEFLILEIEAKQGNVEAEYNLGVCYERGHGVEVNLKTAQEIFDSVIKKGNHHVVGLICQASKQGDKRGQYNLGVCYANGWGVAKDESLAAEWYRKAAEQGLANAQHNLGVCYANGQGVAKDEQQVAEWYRKAAEQGLASAQYDLGRCYAHGLGVERNFCETAHWLRRAMGQQDIPEQDLDAAVTWLRQAAQHGDAVVQYSLGYCYANGQGVANDERLAAEWYQKAAEQGDAAAQFNLGVCYANGQGVAKDERIAVEWYQKAAVQGYASAQFNLGDCYKNGQWVAKDETAAVEWYRKAAEQGNASAQNKLGLCYEYAQGIEKNLTEAVGWYRKAAEQGDASAQVVLGLCYADGKGIAKDERAAVEWYRKAAEQGDSFAQVILGRCYNTGTGVAKDKQIADEWFRKATARGDVNARERGKQLKRSWDWWWRWSK